MRSPPARISWWPRLGCCAGCSRAPFHRLLGCGFWVMEAAVEPLGHRGGHCGCNSEKRGRSFIVVGPPCLGSPKRECRPPRLGFFTTWKRCTRSTASPRKVQLPRLGAPQSDESRADELRNRSCGHVSSSRRLYRQHPQGRQARRPARTAINQIRARHQPANGASARQSRCRQACFLSPTR